MKTSSRNACRTCGEKCWNTSSDDHGNTVYAYSCTAEIVVDSRDSERVIKSCPDIERKGGIK